MQSNRPAPEVEVTRRKVPARVPAKETQPGGASPVIAGIVVLIALGMGVWAVVSSRKVAILEAALQKSREDNESVTKNLAKVTVERDDLAKEKESLAKEVAALRQPTEAMNQMLSGLFSGGAAASPGPSRIPVEGYSKSGRRVRISDGGAAGLLGGQGAMALQGMGGTPVVDPSQAMSQAMAMASAMQQESMRKYAESRPETMGERPPGIQPVEPVPAATGANRAKAIDSMVDRDVNALASQLALAPDQKNRTDEAMRAVAPGLLLYETYRTAGAGSGSGAAAQSEESDAERQERIAQEAQNYRRSSDLFARSMKEILTEKQFPAFLKWKKHRDDVFDAAVSSFERTASRPGGG